LEQQTYPNDLPRRLCEGHHGAAPGLTDWKSFLPDGWQELPGFLGVVGDEMLEVVENLCANGQLPGFGKGDVLSDSFGVVSAEVITLFVQCQYLVL
jgi:hypothetical protein